MPNFRCPYCGAERDLSDRVIGHRYRCPTCKAKVKHHADGRLELIEPGIRPDLIPKDPPPVPPTPVAAPVEPKPPPAPVVPVPAAASPIETAAVALDKMSGRAIGHYLLIGLIGKGGYSHVYLAEHQTLKRKMAVKLLSPKLIPTPEHTARLAQEAVALAKVEHPHVVHVYDFGTEGGIPYLAMEYVDGKTLDEIVKTSGPLPIDQTMDIAGDVLEGLRAIHDAGLLHRDIKPSNILASKDGAIKLADFGLAQQIPNDTEARTNLFVGTADYAAPELAVGRPPDVRTDLYALGATLYKLVTGRAPFVGATPAEKLSKQLYEPIIPPKVYNPKIPQQLEELILRLLHKERDQRPATALETSRLLSLIRKDKGGPKTKRQVLVVKERATSSMPFLGVLGVLILGGILTVVVLQNRKKTGPSAEPKISHIAPPATDPPKPSRLEPEPAENPDSVPRKEIPAFDLPKPPLTALPPPPEVPKGQAVASVLQLKQGSFLPGRVTEKEDGYEVLSDEKKFFLKKDEVYKWFRSAQEMAGEAESIFKEARRVYDLGCKASSPASRDSLLRDAQNQAEAARDRFTLTRKFFSGSGDNWLDERASNTLELLRLIRDGRRLKSAEPGNPAPAPPTDAPKNLGRKGRAMNENILEGLLWLAHHQAADGGWRAQSFWSACPGQGQCRGNGKDSYDIGVSALAVLAILGAGFGYQDQDTYDGVNLGETLRKGCKYLVRQQGPQGELCPESTTKHMYSHLLSSYALAEGFRSISASGSTLKVEAELYKNALGQAVAFSLQGQNPGQGWRYRSRCGDNDSSVTASAILSLEAGKRAGISVPDKAYQGGLDWFREATEAGGRTGYTARGTGKVFVPGLNESFDDHPTMSAASETCFQLVGSKGRTETTSKVIGFLVHDGPTMKANAADFYYWYYGTRLLRAAGTPSEWSTWKDALVSCLTSKQFMPKGLCTRGSWDPNDRWGGEAGRVGATALNVLSLEYAILPKPFSYSSRPADAIDPAAPLTPQWEFFLKTGGRLKVLSYDEKDEKYVLRLAAGTTSVAKDAVEKIEKLEPKKP